MTTDTEAMRIAEKRARGARKSLESSRRSNRQAEQETVASAPVADDTPKERSPRPTLRYRLGLLLCGALVALALAVGAFVVFSPDDRAPSNGFDGSSGPAIDAGGPADGFDPRP
jgi:hypothetical protein